METTKNHIILGAGCAGLQLVEALRTSQNGSLGKVLLLEKEEETPDRTWCFWADRPHKYDHLVSKRWKKLRFAGPERENTFDLGKWEYQYISGKDFFQSHYQQIQSDPRIEIRKESVKSLASDLNGFQVKTGNTVYETSNLYNSIPQTDAKSKSRFFFWQHFKGWFIESENPIFDPEVVTLMDFQTGRDQSVVNFMYVLPFSRNRALLEFTVFSPEISPEIAYDEAIQTYLENHFPKTNYRVEDTEEGKIPMTDFEFSFQDKTGAMNIGGRAGMIKPTTGYTFRRIMLDSEALASEKGRYQSAKRFRLYDKLLLRIMHHHPEKFSGVMEALFMGQPIDRIFRFLDENTSLWEESLMFAKLPIGLFLKSLGDEIRGVA